MNTQLLIDTAKALVADDKGVLAGLACPTPASVDEGGQCHDEDAASSCEVQSCGAPWRIPCRDGKERRGMQAIQGVGA